MLAAPGNDIPLAPERMEGYRAFANKLWNAGRLILSAIEKTANQPSVPPEFTSADRWILARESQVIHEVSRLFDTHQYGEAGRQLNEFFWSEFADWYLEIAKLQLDGDEGRIWFIQNPIVNNNDTNISKNKIELVIFRIAYLSCQ